MDHGGTAETTTSEEELLYLYAGEKAVGTSGIGKRPHFMELGSVHLRLFCLGYRKSMYRSSSSLVFSCCLTWRPIGWVTPKRNGFGIGLVVSVVLGMGGNHLCRQDAEREVWKVRTSHRREHVVMKKGGAGFVSFLFGALLFLAYGLTTGALSVFMECLYL